jgi:P27 family predicted phage terminase small subunit
LKLVTGNAGKRALNRNEPKPESIVPPVPPHLSDEAKVEWGRVANELYELGLLTRIDRASLAGYCQAYADWVEAEDQIRRYGKVVKSPSKKTVRHGRDGSKIEETSGGYPIQSPFLAIRNKALELMHKFAIEFGMTPSSRSRVSANGEKDKARDKSSRYFS